MEFEIDFGTIASTAARPAGPLMASVDGRVAALAADECVFHVRNSDDICVMSMDTLRVLDQMRQFRTRDEQVAHIEQRIPELKGRPDVIARAISGLEQQGLVITANALAERACEGESLPVVDSPIVIRTRNRAQSLRRLLGSLSEVAADRPVYVIDDSVDSATVAENREVVAQSGLSARHLDREWRSRLVKALEPETDRPQTLAQLLGFGDADEGFTGGATWNAATLLTAGQRPILLDDDVRWEPMQRKDASLGRLNVAPMRVLPMTFAAGEDELLEQLQPDARDWLTVLGRACGQPLGVALRELGAEGIDLRTMAGQSLRSLQGLLEGGQVKTLRFGYYGSPQMDTRLWFCLAQPGDAQTLWQDRSRYFRILEHPLMTHGVRSLQLAEQTNFTPTCLDNTSLLPPVPPVHRTEDFAFAALLRYLYPQSTAMHLPTLIAHERPEGRGPENPEAFTPWVSRFFAEYALAHLAECEAESPADRAHQLSSRYADIAFASRARRKEMLREFLGYMRSQVITQLQQALLSAGGSPPYWQEEMTRWIEANGLGLTERAPPRLRGWSDELDADGCAGALAADARRHADWMACWPAAWEACANEQERLLSL